MLLSRFVSPRSRRFVGASALLLGLVLPAAAQSDASAPPAAAQSTAVPAASFFRDPVFRAPQLNDAGTHLAALMAAPDGSFQLVIKDLKSGEEAFLGGGATAEVYDFTWLTDTHLAYNLISGRRYDVGLMVVDVNDPAGAYPVYQYGAARIVGVPQETPMKPLVWVAAARSFADGGVVELDASLNNGTFVDVRGEGEEAEKAWDRVLELNEAHILRVVPQPEGGTVSGYLAARDGGLGYAFTTADGDTALQVWDGSAWFVSPVDPDNIVFVDVGEEPGQILARLPATDGQPAAVHFVNAASGEVGELVFRDNNYDFDGEFYRDPASRALVGTFYTRDGPTVRWFNETYQNLQKILNESFPGKVVRLRDGSVDGEVFLVSVTSDREPLTYFTINLSSRTISRMQGEMPWIDPQRMQGMSIFKYKTADGKQLDAYVTLPAGTSKDKPAPLVVMPHGGPWLRNMWGFHGEAQFLASRGYAVLQPNYRGSPGYDWMFSEAARVDFLAMHDDVTRAVKTLIKTGMVDPERIAILGGGFGGYLALTGLVDEPALYRCGVAHSGLYDWARVANVLGLERENDPAYGEIFARLGDPGRDAAKFEVISPEKRLYRLEDPVLVASTRDAGGVEQAEAEGLQEALRRGGAVYETYLIDGGIGLLENRVALFERIVKFFDEKM